MWKNSNTNAFEIWIFYLETRAHYFQYWKRDISSSSYMALSLLLEIFAPCMPIAHIAHWVVSNNVTFNSANNEDFDFKHT